MVFVGNLQSTYHKKKGSQHNIKAPIIMPKVRAALCSARQLFDCCLIDVPVTKHETFKCN